MTVVLTLVCQPCSAGWEVEDPELPELVDSDPDWCCPWCGRLGEVREARKVVRV